LASHASLPGELHDLQLNAGPNTGCAGKGRERPYVLAMLQASLR
jgi:hypothetical protein